MNDRIFWVPAMEYMCAQTRTWFIFSSERVLGNVVRTHENPKGNIPSIGEVADQAFYLTQSQYTDTQPTSPSADLLTSGREAIRAPSLKLLVWPDQEKSSRRKRESNSVSSALEADALTARPTGQYVLQKGEMLFSSIRHSAFTLTLQSRSLYSCQHNKQWE